MSDSNSNQNAPTPPLNECGFKESLKGEQGKITVVNVRQWDEGQAVNIPITEIGK